MKKILAVTLLFAILVVNGYRFYQLDKVPYGYNIDEYSTAVTIRCFALEKTDCWGHPAGLFMHVGYGTPRPPTYMWPVAVWGKIFGYTIPDIRAFTAFIVVLFGISGVFALGFRVGGLWCGLWSALSASLSPYIFVLSRLGFESIFGAVFLAWGIFFLLKSESKRNMAAAAVVMSVSLYSYPPVRLFLPMLLVAYFLIFRAWRNTWKAWLVFFAVLILVSAPLLQGIVSSELQSRFNKISIFSAVEEKSMNFLWLKQVVALFFYNIGLHLHPKFLFQEAGLVVHSTRQQGLFSWLDYFAWVSGIVMVIKQWPRRKTDASFLKGKGRIILLCIAGFFLSIIPSALTNEYIPNALRISVQWPLVSLLTGLLLAQGQMQLRWLSPVALAIAVAFGFVFLKDFFTKYPDRAKGMFDYWIYENAQKLKTDQDWLKFLVQYRYRDFHVRYYFMNGKNMGCKESFQLWERVYNYFGKGRGY